MKYTVEQKNEFVVKLRNHLMSLYRTSNHYTFGDSDFSAQKVGEAYYLIRRKDEEKKDLSGFCLRKDLCLWPPTKEEDIIREARSFAKESNFNLEKYILSAHIDAGYAGEISVNFTPSIDFILA